MTDLSEVVPLLLLHAFSSFSSVRISTIQAVTLLFATHPCQSNSSIKIKIDEAYENEIEQRHSSGSSFLSDLVGKDGNFGGIDDYRTQYSAPTPT